MNTNRETPGESTQLTTQTQKDSPMHQSLNIINLSDHVLPVDEIRVLEKGLTFCPVAHIDTFEAIKDVHLFVRNLLLKSLYTKKQSGESTIHTTMEVEAIESLITLLEENEPGELIDSLDLDTILAEVDDSISMPLPQEEEIKSLSYSKFKSQCCFIFKVGLKKYTQFEDLSSPT